ncbi:MAG: sigma-54-dependent Fis family transcriptional regulator [Candidatus Eisenbacteria bacterium]|nr:sigma-54-dependent Fis family transcriptional regulator [Candidatus Eisenbacteria bacterium]
MDSRSRAMQRVVEQVRQVAATRAPILIQGEPGTGKALLAETLHHESPRRAEPLVWLDCGALPAPLIERELFGAEAGVEGETDLRIGRFELADRGTLFVDDVDLAPPAAQVRLLRALQDRAFERVGGTRSLRTDVRLIAATSADLEAEVAAGRFREDLCARLSLVRIQMPPLRERSEDIPVMVAVFVREFNREHGRRVSGVTPGALERLVQHARPGNVRELRNTIEGMVVFTEGRRPLDLSDLPQALRAAAGEGEGRSLAAGMTVEEAERALIVLTLRHTGFDKTRAAAMLGIGLRTLYRKIKRYGLPERPRDHSAPG